MAKNVFSDVERRLGLKKKLKYNSSEYNKSASEYEFDVAGGSKLNLWAHSPRIAKLKATNWEKWLVRTGRGKDKVLKNTLKKVIYQDGERMN